MSEELIINGIVDYYELLGVDDGDSRQEIKRAWRHVSKELHPDMQGEEGQALAAVVNDAYETLVDEKSQSRYNYELQMALEDAADGYTEQPRSKWIPGILPERSTAPCDEALDWSLFVDEFRCIGCRKCIQHAPATFRIEPTYIRARVFAQWLEHEENLFVAKDACPVSCIRWVPTSHLASLEYVMQVLNEHNRTPVHELMKSSKPSGDDFDGQAATVRKRKANRKRAISKHAERHAASTLQRMASEVLRGRRLAWLEVTISEANLATGEAAARAAMLAAARTDQAAMERLQLMEGAVPQVGTRTRAIHWTHVHGLHRHHVSPTPGTPPRIIPQEMFGTPFKVTRPEGEIVPAELALVPTPTSNTDGEVVVDVRPRKVRRGRRPPVESTVGLDFDGNVADTTAPQPRQGPGYQLPLVGAAFKKLVADYVSRKAAQQLKPKPNVPYVGPLRGVSKHNARE